MVLKTGLNWLVQIGTEPSTGPVKIVGSTGKNQKLNPFLVFNLPIGQNWHLLLSPINKGIWLNSVKTGASCYIFWVKGANGTRVPCNILQVTRFSLN